VKKRVELSQELLKDCKEFRVTSGTGSDFTVRRGDRRVNARTGFPTKPGEFANFPNSIVNFAPMEDSAEGTLVLSPGDCLIQHKRFLREPIKCKLARGKITEIGDTGDDSRFFKSSLAQFNDPSVYVVSHIGWGCEHRAEIDQHSYRPMELESYGGNILLAFGSNDSSNLGGKNKSPTHLDICMLNIDVTVDGVRYIEKGKFVHPKLASLN
jgi:2,5-dihydroxypyridine 5,6-dioxygenase